MFGLTAHAEFISAVASKQRQIDQYCFTVRRLDRDDALALFSGIIEYQKAHPELYCYTRSRSYSRPNLDNPDHETFMFIDEFDDRDVYWKSLADAAQHDASSAANMGLFHALVVPPPPTGHIVWTEFQDLRIQFGFREPLWPGSSDPQYGDPNASTYDKPANAITATPTRENQIDTQQFRVRTSDHDAAFAAGKAIVDYGRAHPELFYFTRMRSYFRPDPENAELEIWMVITEYDNREVYWNSLMNQIDRTGIGLDLLTAFVAYLPEGRPAGHQVWTEVKEFRVQYEDREPLWPGGPA